MSTAGYKRAGEALDQDDIKRARMELTNGFSASGGSGGSNGFGSASDAAASSLVNGVPEAVVVPPSNFRTTLKFSTPSTYDTAAMDSPAIERQRSALKSIFSMDEEPAHHDHDGAATPPVVDLGSVFPPDLQVDPDMPIDENKHTALHWASALARISLVRALVSYGADMHRGNNVGETPLIRAVLVTNNSDQDSFLRLLEVLGPSLRTVDEMGRSVLHHIALVAGVAGRAASARYYLETILEYVATHDSGRFRDLIDARDLHGDTALNIAARIGSRALVRILLDVEADKHIANKLGLRPTDYGLDDPVRCFEASGLKSAWIFETDPISCPVLGAHHQRRRGDAQRAQDARRRGRGICPGSGFPGCPALAVEHARVALGCLCQRVVDQDGRAGREKSSGPGARPGTGREARFARSLATGSGTSGPARAEYR